jgi:hypothetical protein
MNATTTEPIFTERQYIGRNSYGLARRMVMAIFALIAHFYSYDPMDFENGFFLIGALLIILSIVLFFVPYYTLQLQADVLIIHSRKEKEVRLPLMYIEKSEAVKYSKYHFNNARFNVQDKDEHHFYAEGPNALLLNLQGGHKFRIGCRRAEELNRKIVELQSKK